MTELFAKTVSMFYTDYFRKKDPSLVSIINLWQSLKKINHRWQNLKYTPTYAYKWLIQSIELPVVQNLVIHLNKLYT